MDRKNNPDFVMVELGHGANPVALTQQFKRQRAYIGIETWQSKNFVEAGHERVEGLRDGRPDENIFFLDRPIDPDALEEDDMATVLSDGAADEVLISNVLGDPEVYDQPDGISNVLNEAKRLITPDGKIIVRETITPFLYNVLPVAIEAGLEIDQVSSRLDSDWEQLNDLYAVENPIGDNHASLLGAYYLILSK